MLPLFISIIIMGFAGYSIGRVGHIYGGHLNTPDHWIFGAMLFLPGVVLTGQVIFMLFAFGVGLVISDLKDFINLKCWGPDKVEVLRFWHID